MLRFSLCRIAASLAIVVVLCALILIAFQFGLFQSDEHSCMGWAGRTIEVAWVRSNHVARAIGVYHLSDRDEYILSLDNSRSSREDSTTVEYTLTSEEFDKLWGDIVRLDVFSMSSAPASDLTYLITVGHGVTSHTFRVGQSAVDAGHPCGAVVEWLKKFAAQYGGTNVGLRALGVRSQQHSTKCH